jgi:hypothetical protein
LLAVFLGKDLGGCDTTNESWRTGKDLVGKSAEYVGFVGCELKKRAIDVWFNGRSHSVESSQCLVFGARGEILRHPIAPRRAINILVNVNSFEVN